jgi:uncharacterized lipoprotein YajG
VRSRSLNALLAAAALAGLAACGEKPQILDASSKQPDGEMWGTNQSRHMAAGWNPGDEASWDAQIRSRNQVQNEYVRMRQ